MASAARNEALPDDRISAALTQPAAFDGRHPRAVFEADVPLTAGGGVAPLSGLAQPVAVVGSIIRWISVTVLAGKPLASACLRIRASSSAR